MTKTQALLADAEFVRLAVMRDEVTGKYRYSRTPMLRYATEAGFDVGKSTIDAALSAARLGTRSEDATPEKSTPAVTDEWTLPTGGKLAPVIEQKQAPAHGGTFKRFVIAADVHGDQAHADANRVFFEFVEKQWKPEIRIMAGDLWDFRPLRRNANADEKRESMQSDYTAGLGWLIRFKPDYFLRGNHDERLWQLASDGVGIEQDFASQKIGQIEAQLEELKIKMLPYHIQKGILEIGHLKVAHGFFNGVHAAKQMADVYNSVIFGHNHAVILHPVAGLERRAARCIGALCNLIMPYNERRPSALRQAHGWAYGVLSERTGEYWIWQAESIGGQWLLASDVVSLN